MQKIKVTVDPPEGAPFGYRPYTFFVKLPDRVYGTLLQIGREEGKDFQTVFTESIELGLKILKEEHQISGEL
jgi:hypothetical protein